MNYDSFQPHPDFEAIIKCYWILEVPDGMDAPRQRIVPDGCIEMIFTLGDDVKRFASESEDEFVIQPRAMIIGQITEPFYIQPTGYVNTFAARFYPYGFANFITTPVKNLANKETPLALLFGEQVANDLEQKIIHATDTQGRIEIIENFLSGRLNDQTTIDSIVKSTVDALLMTNGSEPIRSILKDDPSKRRQLERNFVKQIGISPKQLGRVIRLQTALKMLLTKQTENFTEIAYESEYYDQAHFNKDFKEFTGTNPGEFLTDDQMALSTLFYKEE